MLPWIFVILVLLNIGLFVWGHQREKSLGPPPTPVPDGNYEIRLVGEPQEEPIQSIVENRDASVQGAAEDETIMRGRSTDEVAESAVAEKSDPLNGSVVGAAIVLPSGNKSDKAEETALDSASSAEQLKPANLAPESGELETSPTASPAMDTEDTAPESTSEL